MAEYALDYRKRLQSARRELKASDGDRVSRQSQRSQVELLVTDWYGSVAPALVADGIDSDVVDGYDKSFKELLRLCSGSGNRRATYLRELDSILKSFRDDIIVPLQTRPPIAKSLVAEVLADLSDPEENEYLREAAAAAAAGLFRAAAVLGWCAAIDRVHRRIEDLGFAKFNVESAEMATVTKGRYKRFNQTQNVHSLAEIREVFDTVILWVLEGMGLIDTNEHARLRGCFELRSQCAHPGNAPVTEYNLLSFFSDINEIVFKNPKFVVTPLGAID